LARELVRRVGRGAPARRRRGGPRRGRGRRRGGRGGGRRRGRGVRGRDGAGGQGGEVVGCVVGRGDPAREGGLGGGGALDRPVQGRVAVVPVEPDEGLDLGERRRQLRGQHVGDPGR